jgi:hypothetical protein
MGGPDAEIGLLALCGKFLLTPVMAVTEQTLHMGDTPVVNMVRKASKNSLLRAGRHEAAVERGSRC